MYVLPCPDAQFVDTPPVPRVARHRSSEPRPKRGREAAVRLVFSWLHLKSWRRDGLVRLWPRRHESTKKKTLLDAILAIEMPRGARLSLAVLALFLSGCSTPQESATSTI